MVLSNKAKTGGGYGLATPLQQNGRRVALEVSCEHNVYVTTNVDITLGADASKELRMGYHKLLSAIKGSNETRVFLPVIPLSTDNAILEPDSILTKMSKLKRNFMETSMIRYKRTLCGQRPGLVSTDILR